MWGAVSGLGQGLLNGTGEARRSNGSVPCWRLERPGSRARSKTWPATIPARSSSQRGGLFGVHPGADRRPPLSPAGTALDEQPRAVPREALQRARQRRRGILGRSRWQGDPPASDDIPLRARPARRDTRGRDGTARSTPRHPEEIAEQRSIRRESEPRRTHQYRAALNVVIMIRTMRKNRTHLTTLLRLWFSTSAQ